MLQQLLDSNALIVGWHAVQVMKLESLPVGGLSICPFALDLIEEVAIGIKHQVHGRERRAATMIVANLIH